MKKLIIIALILSVITGAAGFQYMKNLEEKAKGETIPVVVAKMQIPIHTEITSNMVEIKNISAEAVNPLYLSAMDEVVGKVSKIPIESFEQVLRSKLVGTEEENSGLSYSIKEGYRALTVKTDEITGVAGQIVKGDRIDIVSTMLAGSTGRSDALSIMVAENVEVLDVGTKQSADDEKNIYTSVTLSVSAPEVLKISHALSEGKYRLVLRSVTDGNLVYPPAYSIR